VTDSMFAVCYPWLRDSEGGNDDDPDDPGGRTSRGITQAEYNAYCSLHDLPHGDVWNATEPAIGDIYRLSYWQPYCPQLPAGPDYVFFDENVNSGLHEAVLVLQRALGVHADGHIGVVTMAAVSKADAARLVNAMSNERIKVYRQMRRFRKYGKGWLRRVEFCRQKALTMIPP
jgi:lysozyme family protein